VRCIRDEDSVRCPPASEVSVLEISDATLSKMRGAADASFPARMLRFVREHLPDRCRGQEQADMERALERAAQWEITGERERASFVVLWLLHGPGLERLPWAREILGSAPRGNRAQRMMERTIRDAMVAGSALAGNQK
jgi:hypothetical protein